MKRVATLTKIQSAKIVSHHLTLMEIAKYFIHKSLSLFKGP